MFAATNEATNLKIRGGWQGKRIGVWRVGVTACDGSADESRSAWGKKIVFRQSYSHENVSTKLITLCKRRHTDAPIRPYSVTFRLRGALEIKFIHVFFGAIDPAISKDDFVVHQTNFFVAGLAKVHPIGDLLAI